MDAQKGDGMRRYIAIVDYKEDGMFCFGIFELFHMALGKLMEAVDDLRATYTDPGDIFEIGAFTNMNNDGGYCWDVRFRKAGCNKTTESRYIILFDNSEGFEKSCGLKDVDEVVKIWEKAMNDKKLLQKGDRGVEDE
jgi:hypothetical protein